MEMTKHDIRNYLEKIYKVPVIDVRTRITLGKFKKDVGKGYITKDDDTKYAYVTLVILIDIVHKLHTGFIFHGFCYFLDYFQDIILCLCMKSEDGISFTVKMGMVWMYGLQNFIITANHENK